MASDEVSTSSQKFSHPSFQMSKFLHEQVFDLVWRDFGLHLVEFSTGLLDNLVLADVKLICDGGEVSKQRDKC